ncbi:MAG: VOC family protein, partial [Propionibacteriaceae bacterium]|nr:VOC family protein [Propionibacteriaceae bacterium]
MEADLPTNVGVRARRQGPLRAVAKPTALDHLVYAVPDVDSYVRDFARSSGVMPVFGGAHPGRGTKNYLVGLDWEEPAYLEFLGLDETQPQVPPELSMFKVGTLGRGFSPRLLTWALRCADIDQLAERGQAAGFDFARPEDASRTTPDHKLLKWRFAVNPDFPFDGLQPFLLDWGDTPHPAQTPGLPSLKLESLSLRHPDPRLATLLALLDWPSQSVTGPRTFQARLRGPNGRLELS